MCLQRLWDWTLGSCPIWFQNAYIGVNAIITIGLVVTVGHQLYKIYGLPSALPSTFTLPSFSTTPISNYDCLTCRTNETCAKATGPCMCLPGFIRRGDTCVREPDVCPTCLIHCDKGKCICPPELVSVMNQSCVARNCSGSDLLKSRVRSLRDSCGQPPFIKDAIIPMLLNSNFVDGYNTSIDQRHQRRELVNVLFIQGLRAKHTRGLWVDLETARDQDRNSPGHLTKAMHTFCQQHDDALRLIKGFIDPDSLKEYPYITMLHACPNDLVTCLDDIREKHGSIALTIAIYRAMVLKDFITIRLLNKTDMKLAVEVLTEEIEGILLSCFYWLVFQPDIYAQIGLRLNKILGSLGYPFEHELDDFTKEKRARFENPLGRTNPIRLRSNESYTNVSLYQTDLLGSHSEISIKIHFHYYTLPLNVLYYCPDPASTLCIDALLSNLVAEKIRKDINKENNCYPDEILNCELPIYYRLHEFSSYTPGVYYWYLRLYRIYGVGIDPFEAWYRVLRVNCKEAENVTAEFIKICSLESSNIKQ